MKILICSCWLFFISTIGITNAVAIGATNPVVSEINGNVVNTAQFILSGAGFGQRSSSPVKWDSFDQGTSGSELSGWKLFRDNDSSGQSYPKYSNKRSRSGSLSGEGSFLGSQYNCSAYIEGLDLPEIYVSYWVYIERVSGVASRNVKLTRVISGIPTFNSGGPSIGSTGFYAENQNWYSFNGVNSGDEKWGNLVTEGAWHRVELYGKISTPNVANGKRGYWMDHQEVDYDGSYMTLTSNSDATSYGNVLLPFYVAHSPGGSYKLYYDNVYIDSTRSRVEIGNAANWDECTLREVQIPTAWSNSSITLTANTNSFSNGTAWVYVVDADGKVSPGLPITIASSSGQSAPAAVQGFGKN